MELLKRSCGCWHEAGILALGGGPSGLRTPQPRLDGAGRGVGRAGGACPGLQGEGGRSTQTHPQSRWLEGTRNGLLMPNTPQLWPENGLKMALLNSSQCCMYVCACVFAPQKCPQAGGLGGAGAAVVPGGSIPGRALGLETSVLQQKAMSSASVF